MKIVSWNQMNVFLFLQNFKPNLKQSLNEFDPSDQSSSFDWEAFVLSSTKPWALAKILVNSESDQLW